ncbi:MAG: TMEM165/GDT1 family protein [Coleofasciculaceae cyanobacterium SM2_1_6]|nr:TMEM165/GDT1 family protein [Coleofasciculaceae cyanobacterium SM2_1_6]
MLEAFTAGLTLITISELGDKTFFIAVILAMRYSRLLVFGAVLTALALMTVISVLFGQVVSLLPAMYIKYAEIVLFLGFGIKLIYDGLQMQNKSIFQGKGYANNSEVKEAAEMVNSAMDQPLHQPVDQPVDQSLDQSLQKSQINQKKLGEFWQTPLVKIFIQGFSLTFLAEWGDRTQIATVALAAAKNPWGVTLGSVCGHALCTVIAVFGGRLIAGKISEKTITILGGVLFLIFAGVAIRDIT